MTIGTISRWMFTAGCLGSLWLAAVPARAQSSSLFGSGSVSNRSSSGFSGPSSGFSGMGGGSGLGGMGSGFGGMGGSGGLGGFGGTSGFGGSNSFGNNRGGFGAAGQGTGFGNQANAQGGFIGRNTNPNQFIGLNTLTGGNTGTNASGQFPFGGQGNRNNMSGQFNFNSLNQNQNSQGQNQPSQLRARQKVAFTFTKPPADAFQTQVQTRFNKLAERNAGLANVSLSTEPAGVVVLQGEVASESDARLAEKLVRLEPGVRSIRSELTFPPAVDAE